MKEVSATTRDRQVLRRAVVVNTIGIAAKTSRPLFLILFSRTLGTERFGLYLLAFAIAEVVSKFAALGMERGLMFWVGLHANRENPRNIRSGAERAILAILGLSALSAVLLVLLAEWIAVVVVQKPELTAPLQIFALGIPSTCCTYALLLTIRPRLDMRYEVFTQSLVEPLLILGMGSYFLLVSGWGVNGIAIAHVLASLSTAVLSFYFFRRLYPAGGDAEPLDWRTIWKNGVPTGGVEFLNMFKLRLDLFVIGKFLPLATVGIYGAMVEVTSLLRKARAAFDPIVMPMAQSLHFQGEKERLKKNLGTALGWVLLPAMALLGPMWLVPEGFLQVFGQDFAVGSTALMIFAFGQVLAVTLGLLEGTLAMTGHASVILINAVVLIVVNLVLLLALVPAYGIEGAAAATTVATVGVTLWRVHQTKQLLGVLPFERAQLRPVWAFVVALCAAWIFLQVIGRDSFVKLVATSLFYGGVYASVVWWLRRRAAPHGSG